MTGSAFEQAWTAYGQWIGLSGSVPVKRRGQGRPPKRKKIIVAGDFHVPFHDRAALKQLVVEESPDTECLIVNGDLLDCWSTSRYPKSKKLTDPVSEMAEAQAVVNLLARSFRDVRIVSGNHDARPQKYIVDRLPAEVLDYISMTGPMVFRPLEFLTAKLDNVNVVPAVLSGTADFAFLSQTGDLLCTQCGNVQQNPGQGDRNGRPVGAVVRHSLGDLS